MSNTLVIMDSSIKNTINQPKPFRAFFVVQLFYVLSMLILATPLFTDNLSSSTFTDLVLAMIGSTFVFLNLLKLSRMHGVWYKNRKFFLYSFLILLNIGLFMAIPQYFSRSQGLFGACGSTLDTTNIRSID